MRAQIFGTLLACLLAPPCTNAAAAAGEPLSSPSGRALAFFAALPPGDTTAVLASLRPTPLDARSRAQVVSALPREGALRPNADELVKLGGLEAILTYHERDGVIESRVIDVPQAFVGLHAQAVLLISRRALRLISQTELQALAAHEIGHEYFWAEYERARDANDALRLQELELKCDGIAALTLTHLRLDPFSLDRAVRKLTAFNEAAGAAADTNHYPGKTERTRFLRDVLTFWSHRPTGAPPGTSSTPVSPEGSPRDSAERPSIRVRLANIVRLPDDVLEAIAREIECAWAASGVFVERQAHERREPEVDERAVTLWVLLRERLFAPDASPAQRTGVHTTGPPNPAGPLVRMTSQALLAGERRLAWIPFLEDSPGTTIFVSVGRVQGLVNQLKFGGQRVAGLPDGFRVVLLGRALGRIVAHEIGHYLRGASHTATGLMKSALTQEDLLCDMPPWK